MGQEPRLVLILSAHVLFSCFDLLFLLVLEFTLSSRVLCHFRDILRLLLSDLLVFHRPVVFFCVRADLGSLVSLKFLFCMLGPSEQFHNINAFRLQTLYRDGGQLAILFLKPSISPTKIFAPPGVIPMFFISLQRAKRSGCRQPVEEMWIGLLKSKLVNI